MSTTTVVSPATTVNMSTLSDPVQLTVYWNGWIVFVSIIVAVVASYVALGALQARHSKLLLLIGAVNLSLAGIWSLHFLGQLSAFNVDAPMKNDVGLSVGSAFFALLGVSAGFLVIDHWYPPELQEDENTFEGNINSLCQAPWLVLVGSALCLAVGIAAMHFSAMAGFSVPGGRIDMDMGLIAVCAVLAVVVSLVALVLAFVLPLSRKYTAPTSLVFGIAIAVVHYTNHAFGMDFYISPELKEPREGHESGMYYASTFVTFGSLLLSFLSFVVLSMLSRNAAAPDAAGRVALVITDIQQSTRLWRKHPAAMATALTLHNSIIHRCIKKSRGFKFKEMGDSQLICLRDPKDAVMLAARIQRELFNAVWPPEIDQEYRHLIRHHKLGDSPVSGVISPPTSPSLSMPSLVAKGHSASFENVNTSDESNNNDDDSLVPIPGTPSVGAAGTRGGGGNSYGDCWNGLRVRVGVHLSAPGACEMREDAVTGMIDVFGDPVNLASRVSDCASGGQIVVTSAVVESLSAEVLRDELKLKVEALGSHDLKGIEDQTILYQLLPEEFSGRMFGPLRTEANKDLERSRSGEDGTGSNYSGNSSTKHSPLGSRSSTPEGGGGGGGRGRHGGSRHSSNNNLMLARGASGHAGKDGFPYRRSCGNSAGLDDIDDIIDNNGDSAAAAARTAGEAAFSALGALQLCGSNLEQIVSHIDDVIHNEDAAAAAASESSNLLVRRPTSFTRDCIRGVVATQRSGLQTVMGAMAQRASDRVRAVEALCGRYDAPMPKTANDGDVNAALTVVAGVLGLELLRNITLLDVAAEKTPDLAQPPPTFRSSANETQAGKDVAGPGSQSDAGNTMEGLPGAIAGIESVDSDE